MSQLLPPNEEFDLTSPDHHGSTPLQWFRIQAWTTDPGYGSSGTEFTNCIWRDQTGLSDGYGSTKGSSSSAVITTQLHDDISDPEGFTPTADWYPRLGGYVFRRSVLEDCDVRAGFTYAAGGFPINGGSQRYTAVGCRISGGTLADSGDKDLERLTLADGYWFVRLSEYGSAFALRGTKYALLRVNGGSITRLAENPTGSGNTHPYILPASFSMRMSAETVGGNVQLRCYVRGALEDSADPSITLRSNQWQEVLSYLDSSVSKISGDGRMGFGMTMERQSASQLFAHLCTYCEGRPLGGNLAFRDEWLRPHRANSRFVSGHGSSSTHAGPKPGYSLASLWSGDLQGVWDPVGGSAGSGGPGGTIQMISGRARIAAGKPTDYPGWLGLITNQVVENAVEQRRSMNARFLSDGTTNNDEPRLIGILERERASNSHSNLFTGRGYVFFLARDDDAATWECGVIRMNAGLGQFEVIAWKGSLSLTQDTDIGLDFQLTNVDGPNQVANAVEMKCWINAAQVAFDSGPSGSASNIRPGGYVPSYTSLGITIDGSGTIVDEASNRHISGIAEGVLVTNTGNGGGDRSIEFDDWTQGTLTVPEDPPPPPVSDQASVVIPAECPVAPTETLVFPHTWPVSRDLSSRAITHKLETQHTVRMLEDPNQPEAWTVEASAMREAEREYLRAFFLARDGIVDPFYWEDPDGTTQTVTFGDEDLEDALKTRGATNVRIRLLKARC